MALLLAVSACFTFLTACGQTEAAGDQLALAVCVGETPATYDPIYAEEPGEQTVLNPLYENLMRLEQDENGQTCLLYTSGGRIVAHSAANDHAQDHGQNGKVQAILEALPEQGVQQPPAQNGGENSQAVPEHRLHPAHRCV